MANVPPINSLDGDDKPKEEPCLPVDQKWLEKVINEKTGGHGRIRSCSCSVIGEGKGFLSVCTRVVIEWEEGHGDLAKLPKGVVIKEPTLSKIGTLGIQEMTDFIDQDMLKQVHNNEVRAYQFFNKHGPSPPIPLATLFHAEEMAEPGTGMLILEDLSPVAVSLAFGEDSNKEKMLHLAEHLATLQAYGLNHSDWSDYIHPMNMAKLKEVFSDTEGMAKKAKETFPEAPYTAEEILRAFTDATVGFDYFADPRDNGYTPVVALGDVQPNNILWRMNAEGNTSDTVAAFIDFQVAMVGYCVTDLANTLITTLPAKIRRECEDEVFQRYLETLKEKCNEPVKLTMAEVKTIYRKFLIMMSIATFPMFAQIFKSLGIEQEKKPEMYDRFLAAFEDSKMKD